MIARNLLRRLAIGASAFSNYGRQLTIELLNLADSVDTDSDAAKVVAAKFGIKGKNLTRKIALLAAEDYSLAAGTGTSMRTCNWLKQNLTQERFDLLSGQNVLPANVEQPILEALSPSSKDMDEMFLRAARCSLTGFSALHLISDLRDVVGAISKSSSLPEWCSVQETEHQNREARGQRQDEELFSLLVESIIKNEISGVVFFVGCERPDQKELTMLEELARNDVLPFLVGCQNVEVSGNGIPVSSPQGRCEPSLAPRERRKRGLSPTRDVSFAKLAETLRTNSEFQPFPMLGSCLEATWIADFANQLATRLGVDASNLPLMTIISGQTDRRIEVMGHWMMALGMPVYWMKVPPLMGSQTASRFWTKIVRERFGGEFLWRKETSELVTVLRQRSKNAGLQI
jgi:hydroxylamine reductase (hybrid-cluster protein)